MIRSVMERAAVDEDSLCDVAWLAIIMQARRVSYALRTAIGRGAHDGMRNYLLRPSFSMDPEKNHTGRTDRDTFSALALRFT